MVKKVSLLSPLNYFFSFYFNKCTLKLWDLRSTFAIGKKRNSKEKWNWTRSLFSSGLRTFRMDNSEERKLSCDHHQKHLYSLPIDNITFWYTKCTHIHERIYLPNLFVFFASKFGSNIWISKIGYTLHTYIGTFNAIKTEERVDL